MDINKGILRFFRRNARTSRLSEENVIDTKNISPNLNMYIWRPIISSPSLCFLKDLQDGTYNINDLADMHEALDLLSEVNQSGSD